MLKQISIPGTSFGLSAMAFGAGAFDGRLDAEGVDRLYAMFRSEGGTCFDTAHCYCFWLPGGSGCAERALGACIRRHRDEGNVRIVSKGGHPGVEPGYARPERYLSPEVIAGDLGESLERLGVAAIDVYLLHRDDARVPVGEIVDALNAHIAAGRIRAIGVSNWSIARLTEANAYAQRRGLRGFVVSQPEFSMAKSNAAPATTEPAMRFLTEADIAWHRETGMPVMAYSPTASGYFASDGQRAQKRFDNDVSRGRLSRARELAAKLGATVNQVALAYLMCQGFPVIPVLGTADVAHLSEALGASRFELTPEQLAWLRDGSGTQGAG